MALVSFLQTRESKRSKLRTIPVLAKPSPELWQNFHRFMRSLINQNLNPSARVSGSGCCMTIVLPLPMPLLNFLQPSQSAQMSA
jgi:hypothetical protein